MDTATFKRYTEVVVRSIAEIDAKIGEVVEEYVGLVVDEKEGNVDKASVQSVLDRFPKVEDTSAEMVSLVASLFRLVVVFQVD